MQQREITLRLSWNHIATLIGLLREAGQEFEDVQAKLGISWNEAKACIERLRGMSDSMFPGDPRPWTNPEANARRIEIEFSQREAKALARAGRALPETMGFRGEYHSRIGRWPEEVEPLLHELEAALV